MTAEPKSERRTGVLVLIVLAQFACTSLWFAGNAVMRNLVEAFALGPDAVGNLTSAVQFGFILGTLTYAVLAVADRFSPSKVFLWSALAAAVVNLGVATVAGAAWQLLLLRFLTGLFLAGIYPVGMKIAADYFEAGLGKALGFLVGALVLGTAFPHLLQSVTATLPWKTVLFATSGMAILGGLLIGLGVADGPHRRKSQHFQLKQIFGVFRNRAFRKAAFGYFGHMWELYAYWAFTPVMLSAYQQLHPESSFSVPVVSFIVIGIGSLSCIFGGYLSLRIGPAKTAIAALALSGLCCLLSPLMFGAATPVFIGFLVFWGVFVIADSPMFSTLVARNAPPEARGTALTLVNSIGFFLTIVSIQLIVFLQPYLPSSSLYVVLGLGPAFGLLAMLLPGSGHSHQK